jgi:hypothetical protein
MSEVSVEISRSPGFLGFLFLFSGFMGFNNLWKPKLPITDAIVIFILSANTPNSLQKHPLGMPKVILDHLSSLLTCVCAFSPLLPDEISPQTHYVITGPHRHFSHLLKYPNSEEITINNAFKA